MTTREGENEKTWFRSDRFFKVGDNYFFTTREGANVGPFTSKLAAKDGLTTFIELRMQDHSAEHAEKAAVAGKWSANLEW